jgi:hypothetical protein
MESVFDVDPESVRNLPEPYEPVWISELNAWVNGLTEEEFI